MKKKKKRTRKQLEFELKLTLVAMMFIFGVLLIITGLYFLEVTGSDIQVKYFNVSLDVSELNEEDKIIVREIIGELKDIYLEPQKSIRFTYEIIQSIGDIPAERLNGYNSGHGDIVVEFTNNKEGMMRTLCHESLHTIIHHSEISHKIVYDLANQFPCYKSDRKIKLNLGK